MKHDPERTRRARELALAILSAWLVIQNALLAVVLPWGRLAPVAPLLAALVGGAALAAVGLWVLPLAALLGWGAPRNRTEVRHD